MPRSMTIQADKDTASGWAVATGIVLTQDYVRTDEKGATVVHVYKTDDAYHQAVEHASYIEGASVIPYVEDK